jgi:hypothetical protein
VLRAKRDRSAQALAEDHPGASRHRSSEDQPAGAAPALSRQTSPRLEENAQVNTPELHSCGSFEFRLRRRLMLWPVPPTPRSPEQEGGEGPTMRRDPSHNAAVQHRMHGARRHSRPRCPSPLRGSPSREVPPRVPAPSSAAEAASDSPMPNRPAKPGNAVTGRHWLSIIAASAITRIGVCRIGTKFGRPANYSSGAINAFPSLPNDQRCRVFSQSFRRAHCRLSRAAAESR